MLQPFIAAKNLSNPHLQTLLPRLLRGRAKFKPFFQELELPDGDFVDLAWSEDWKKKKCSGKRIFVLFHGLEGSFYSPYANGLMDAFAREGWLSVMMHFRGCSGRVNRKARSYHSGEIEDARFFLLHLRHTFPQNKKVTVGVSLGGNMLANYLAEHACDPILDAATLVSAPLDLAACSRRMEQGFSRVYAGYLINSLKKSALKKIDLLEKQIQITAEDLRSIHTLYDFDEKVTAPLHGFRDADDYYSQCSGKFRLNDITIPVDIIQAQDDPFMTSSVIPSYPLRKNVKHRLYDHGGHVGFITGSLSRPKFWLEESLPGYYSESWKECA